MRYTCRSDLGRDVCLLKVLDRAGLKLDLAIYVQRYRHGHWADEDWLGLDQNIEAYLNRLSVAAALANHSRHHSCIRKNRAVR
jgi:hypothetical protein